MHRPPRDMLFWVVIGEVANSICLIIGFSQAPAVHFFPLGREEDMGALTLGTWTRCVGCVGLEDKGNLCTVHMRMQHGPGENKQMRR
jgi:hypothetical protein